MARCIRFGQTTNLKVNAMFLRILTVSVLVLFSCCSLKAQNLLADKLEKFDHHAAIMMWSQSIDEMPLWTPNGEYVCFNMAGDWFAIGLEAAKFTKTKLCGYKVGILKNLDIIGSVDEADIATIKESNNYGMREITLPNGDLVTLTADLWKSTLSIAGKEIMVLNGNSHSLTANEDGSYLAFISELNGLIVLDLTK